MSESRIADSQALQVHPKDNMATALTDLAAGERCTVATNAGTIELTTRHHIPFGHKVALRDILPGGEVIKFGEVIGEATQAILAGDHVHVHNVVSRRGRGNLHGFGGFAGMQSR